MIFIRRQYMDIILPSDAAKIWDLSHFPKYAYIFFLEIRYLLHIFEDIYIIVMYLRILLIDK